MLPVYVYDINCLSDTFEEAKKVLKLLYVNGFVLDLLKCGWMVHTLQVLG